MLTCPVDINGANFAWSTKTWSKFIAPKKRAKTGEFITLGQIAKQGDSNVAYNVTFGDLSEDIWFSGIEGELTIWNLMLNKAGLYKCHYVGSGNKTIQLIIEGMLFYDNSSWLIKILLLQLVLFSLPVWSDDLSISDWLWWHLKHVFRKRTGIALVRVMASVPNHAWAAVDVLSIGPWETIVKILPKFETFHWRKCVSKCCSSDPPYGAFFQRVSIFSVINHT